MPGRGSWASCAVVLAPTVPRRHGCAPLCSGTCMVGSLAIKVETNAGASHRKAGMLQEAPNLRAYSPIFDLVEKFPKLKSEMRQPGGSSVSRKEKRGFDENQHTLGSDPALGPEVTAWHQLTSSSDHPGLRAPSHARFSRRKWAFRWF